ncbi:hypothetical protein RUMCAL_03006 [Ruminococcus callidus ATCC 27760]|uniref:Uncharacterized protein n=1 Tax=Ruminococcus callidus ATCC 27760 TaxID=411473 RepID=U2KA60_9FIRM|nr:hypothetical protein RUMCAL_03006 [Ruminococcus callidus ATCC 27760]
MGSFSACANAPFADWVHFYYIISVDVVQVPYWSCKKFFSFFSGSLTSRYFYDMIGATSKSYNLCTILKSIPHILQNVFQIP